MRYFTPAADGQPAVDVTGAGAGVPGPGGHGFGWVPGQVSTAFPYPKSCAADCNLGADPYVLIKCENQTMRSPVQHNTTSAIFDTQVIFYRKNIDSPIVIQVR